MSTALSDTAEPPVEVLDDAADEMRVRLPVVVIEGQDTSDGRYITPGGLTHRALPLSILAQPESSHGGSDPGPAVIIGRIDTLTRTPGPELISRQTGEPFGPETFVWSGTGVIDARHPVADLVRRRFLRGVSVDLVGMDFEVIGDNALSDSEHPQRRIVAHAAQIGAVTLVPLAAFGDCYVELADEETVPEPITAEELPEGLMASAAPAWRSAELGDTALTPIGFTAEDAPSREEFAERFIAKAKSRDRADLIPDDWTNGSGASLETVTAAVDTPTLPPIEWFRDPGLDQPTIPPVVTDDGRVFGHVAAWQSRHIGCSNGHVDPPRSRTDYAYFHTGAVRVLGDDGQLTTIPAGHIALDTGHAGLSADHRSAAAHYDNTGSLVADVCAGEDEHGIWVAGAVVPGVDDIKLHKLRSCGLSGDWRRIGTGLELVAAISVPTPGFPIPRARVASGQPLALVAAGTVQPPETPPEEQKIETLDVGKITGGFATTVPGARIEFQPTGQVTYYYGNGVNQFDGDPSQPVPDVEALTEAVQARLDERRELSAAHASLVEELDDTPAVVAALLAEVDDTPERVAELLAELDGDDVEAFDVSRMPPQLQASYLKGEVAARIVWGTPGDWRRCVAQAKIHGMGRKAEGACNMLHKKAVGYYPGDKRNK